MLISCTNFRYKKSDHYSEKTDKFFNSTQNIEKSFFDLFKWKFTSEKSEWPSSVPLTAKPKMLDSIATDQANINFINHSTFLIQIEKVNILTDPVFSERVSPVSFAGPKRVHPPGIDIEKLPKIDVVLISHNHYDHLDLNSLKKLEEQHSPVFFCPLGDKELLISSGLKKVIELDWWEVAQFNNIDIFFVPAQHWSGRGLFDRFKSLWGGYIIKSNKKNIYFAGDTGYSQHFKDIQNKFETINLALLPIGAYSPRWFMQGSHMDPEEAVWAHIDLNSKQSLGMHFGTFQLTDEPINEPSEKLLFNLRHQKINKKEFFTLKPGESKLFDL